jgi:hypothetical protein
MTIVNSVIGLVLSQDEQVNMGLRKFWVVRPTGKEDGKKRLVF